MNTYHVCSRKAATSAGCRVKSSAEAAAPCRRLAMLQPKLRACPTRSSVISLSAASTSGFMCSFGPPVFASSCCIACIADGVSQTHRNKICDWHCTVRYAFAVVKYHYLQLLIGVSSAVCMWRSLSQNQMQRCAPYALVHSHCSACINQNAGVLCVPPSCGRYCHSLYFVLSCQPRHVLL